MGKLARFVNKKKEELTKDELRTMVRNQTYTKNIPVERMLEYYGFQDIYEYIEFLRSKGLKISSLERIALRESSSTSERTKGETNCSFLKAKDLKAMREYRGLTKKETAEAMNFYSVFLDYWERTNPVSNDVAGYYMEALNISQGVAKQIRDYNEGKIEYIQEDRRLTERLKHEVRERDNNQCTNCGRRYKLHFHHIKKFSEGGQNKLENLKLLCVSCHAEEHKNDKSYYMLKSMAEE